jgi:hypothetical protein
VTDRTSTSGLPIRVPMAQLPPVPAGPADPAPPPGDGEWDLDQTGGTLAAFYGGVHRAEAEPPDPDAPTQQIDPIMEDHSGAEPTSA